MISYDDALRQVIEAVVPLPPVDVPLEDAQGLVLAAPALATWDMPRCDNSAMDGVAIAYAETTETGFEIIGASFAGHPYQDKLEQGQAVRITTGAALPQGADTVIPVEDIEERDGRVYLLTTPEPGQHVRYLGEEFKSGDTLATRETRLTAGEIALLASAGIEQVRAIPRPCIAIISTGDELVNLGENPGPGQIINSNMYLLAARLKECGCTPVCIGIGPDDPRSLDKLVDQALGCDAIISTGGVSVGEKDHVQETLAVHNFKKIFWKVAIKPGKPVLFGVLEDKPYFGLPGNPAAAAATFELFVKPALRRLAGQTEVLPETRRAILTNDVSTRGKRQAFLWCQLTWRGNEYSVAVSQRQGSGQNRCLTAVNAILPVPVGSDGIKAGAEVDVLLL